MRKYIIAILLIVLASMTGCQPAFDPQTPEPQASSVNLETPGEPTHVPETEASSSNLATPVEPTQVPEPEATSLNLETPVDPINVAVVLDTDNKVEAIIPVEGGTLSAVGADGTLYTLEIPADALLNETTIGMTPVSSLSGMPFGSEQTYAVQLSPEGLFFYNFAILTITPLQEIPIDEQILFGYEADGQNLGLALPVVESLQIQIQLLHFSGYGVTKGFLADLEPVRQRLGGTEERRLQSSVAVVLQGDRQAGEQDEQDSELFSKFRQDIAQQYYDKVVKPRLDAAGESCAAGRLATETYITYEQQLKLLWASKKIIDDIGVQVANLAAKSMKICLQEEYELCRDEHIVHRIIPAAIGAGRIFQVLKEVDPTLSVLQEAVQLTEKCLRFELEFKSTAADSGPDGSLESRVSAIVPIRFNAPTFELKGQGPLVNEFFQATHSSCAVTSNPGGGTFVAYDLSWSVISSGEVHTDPNRLGPLSGQIQDIRLQIGTASSESWVHICAGSAGSPLGPFWGNRFQGFHYDKATSTIFFTGWKIEGGELFARVEWQNQGQIGTVTDTESGSMVLYHRPGE